MTHVFIVQQQAVVMSTVAVAPSPGMHSIKQQYRISADLFTDVQKVKHHVKPSVSQDSQLSSATALHSHAAVGQQPGQQPGQWGQDEEEVTSPLQLGSHAESVGGDPPLTPAPLQAQPMQLDSTHHQTDMDIDSPADSNIGQTAMAEGDHEGHAEGGYSGPSCAWPKAGTAASSDSCTWPKAGTAAAANSCAWPKTGASFTSPKEYHAADFTDHSMQERLEAGRHATVSDQPATHDSQASGVHTHSMTHSPAASFLEEQGQYAAALRQHATSPGHHGSALRHHGSALGQHGTGPGQQAALWQGQLGEPGSPGAPMQLAASTAAMLSLAQQANQSGGSVQHSKRKQAGELLALPPI